MKNRWQKISDYLLYGAIVIGLYGGYQIYINNAGLPPGVCPVENNRPILYLAIMIAILSIVFSFIGDKKTIDHK